MNQESNQESLLRIKLKGLGIQLVTVLVDAIFLSLWVVCQFGVELLIERLKLSGIIDAWLFRVFQVLFALSTLAPVVINIYVDIRVMIIRAQRQIQQEEQLNRTGGVNDESSE